MTPSVSPRRIIDVLAVNLGAAFDNLCTHRYGGPVSLERADAPDSASVTARFRLHSANLPEVCVDFFIRHVGGNVYDLQGTIEDGPSRTFTYSLPDSDVDQVPQAPLLAREVSSFLLDALERRVGNDLLRTGMRDHRQPAQPDRSATRSPSPSRP